MILITQLFGNGFRGEPVQPCRLLAVECGGEAPNPDSGHLDGNGKGATSTHSVCRIRTGSTLEALTLGMMQASVPNNVKPKVGIKNANGLSVLTLLI